MRPILFKILVAGDGAVGKTTLLHRFIEGDFIDSTKMTIGVDFHTKKIEYPDYIVHLQLWDIGGQERFRFMVDQYLRGARGALLLFDTTSMTSFVNIEKWVQILRKDNRGLPIVLVGTKYDLEEFSMVGDYYSELTRKRFQMFDYVKTSSKWGLNVDKVFEVIIMYLINALESNIIKKEEVTIS